MKQASRALMPDLDEWQRWSHAQRGAVGRARDVKGRLRASPPERAEIHVPNGEIHTVVVAEKLTPSCRAAVLEPVRHLAPEHTAVITPVGTDLGDIAPHLTAVAYDGPDQLGASVRAIVSLGAYLGLSGPLDAWAQRRDIPFHLVQHGLLTPWSPPASRGAHVLAWSDADAEYWSQGRPDVSVDVVGSQMLWSASQLGETQVLGERPVMLGQLHGSELGRGPALQAYWSACRNLGMDYRPHPNESDVISRSLHSIMRRGGISFENSGLPLPQLGRPVVSIFSTGTLEAAMRGLPAWVYHPSPRDWVRDFWRRYGLAEWGDDPTPAWQMPAEPPARAVARTVESA